MLFERGHWTASLDRRFKAHVTFHRRLVACRRVADSRNCISRIRSRASMARPRFHRLWRGEQLGASSLLRSCTQIVEHHTGQQITAQSANQYSPISLISLISCLTTRCTSAVDSSQHTGCAATCHRVLQLLVVVRQCFQNQVHFYQGFLSFIGTGLSMS